MFLMSATLGSCALPHLVLKRAWLNMDNFHKLSMLRLNRNTLVLKRQKALVAVDICVEQENNLLFLYTKSFIDQNCLVKMAGYWPCSCFGMFMDLNSVSIRKLLLAKKNFANIQPS